MQIEYNGISLNYVTVRQFLQEPAYDQSQTDYLYTRFYLVADCFWSPYVFPCTPQPAGNPLNDQLPGTLGSGESDLRGALPAVAMAGNHYPDRDDSVRQALNVPRRKLIVRDDEGNVLLESPRGSPSNIRGLEVTDDKLGPIPKVLNIVRLAGSSVWLVSFAIETWQTQTYKAQRGPILSNRWKQSMVIDQGQFQKRTHSGRLIMRAGSANWNDVANYPTADAYRGWVFPPIPAGFQRENAQYTLAENGLALDYSISDAEQYRICDPNGPATKIDARYTEMTSNGCTFESEIYVRVHGRPSSNTLDLLAIAAQIVLSRIGTKNDPRTGLPAVGGKTFLAGQLRSASVTEDLMKPVIEMRAKILNMTPRGNISGKPLIAAAAAGATAAGAATAHLPGPISAVPALASVVGAIIGKAFGAPGEPIKTEAKISRKKLVAPVKGVNFGLGTTRIGAPVPGTINRLDAQVGGLSAGYYGTADLPGLQLLSQILSSPEGTVREPGLPVATPAVISPAPESVIPG